MELVQRLLQLKLNYFFKVFSLLFLMIFLSLIYLSSSVDGSQHDIINGFQGRQYRLSETKFLIRFNSEANLVSIDSILTVYNINLIRDVSMLNIKIVEASLPGTATDVREMLKSNPLIDFTSPVYYRSDFPSDDIFTFLNQLIIKLDLNTPESVLADLNKEYGCQIKKIINFSSFKFVLIDKEIPYAIELLELSEICSLLPEVKYAGPNWYQLGQGLSSIPNDEYFDKEVGEKDQWYLDDDDDDYGGKDHDIDAPEAWDISKGSSSVRIGIIDTGIGYWGSTPRLDRIHEDFKNPFTVVAVSEWYDATDDDNTALDMDQDTPGHGTRVSGIAAASTNNSSGIASLPWNKAKVIPIRCVYNDTSNGSTNSQQWILASIEHAVNHSADVINMSWYFNFVNQQDPIEDALEDAYVNSGCVLVAASGNKYPADVDYPASSQWVIAIGASTKNDTRWSQSQYGNSLEVMAPGVDIYGPLFDPYNPSNLGEYVADTATSWATPLVSGLAALLKSFNYNLTNVQIREIIARSAEKVGGYAYNQQKTYGTWNNEMGYGRINAYQALLLALGYTNNSHSSLATAYNNGRKLLRDSAGKYHLVFESGGEVFYRHSNLGGTVWEAPIRLSTGNGNNKYPSITGTSTKQFVVWQHYDAGNSKYYSCFSKNTGSGWSDADTIDGLSNFSASNNPLPVISYKNNDRVMVCIRGSAKLRYAYSDNNGSSWTASDLSFTSSSHANPSLSLGPTTPASTIYLTCDNGSTIYLNSYTTSWGSSESIPAGTATTNSKYSSVEVDGTGGIDVSWEGRKKFANKQIIWYT